MISFDTNILVYAADPQAGERHDRAVALVGRAMRLQTCLQPLQTFCEFFNVATKKLRIEPGILIELIDAWSEAVTVEPANHADLGTAMRGVRDYRLAFWDALIWATIRRVGGLALITEDFQDGQTLEGVRFVNPFAAANDWIVDRLVSHN